MNFWISFLPIAIRLRFFGKDGLLDDEGAVGADFECGTG